RHRQRRPGRTAHHPPRHPERPHPDLRHRQPETLDSHVRPRARPGAPAHLRRLELAGSEPLPELTEVGWVMAPTPLRDAVVSPFSRLSAEDPSPIDGLRPLYAEDVVFEDPVQRVEGVDAFLDLNRRLARRARELSFQ